MTGRAQKPVKMSEIGKSASGPKLVCFLPRLESYLYVQTSSEQQNIPVSYCWKIQLNCESRLLPNQHVSSLSRLGLIIESPLEYIGVINDDSSLAMTSFEIFMTSSSQDDLLWNRKWLERRLRWNLVETKFEITNLFQNSFVRFDLAWP